MLYQQVHRVSADLIFKFYGNKFIYAKIQKKKIKRKDCSVFVDMMSN